MDSVLSMQRGEDKLPPKFEGVISVYDEASSRRDYKVELAYTETLASVKPSTAVAAPTNSELSSLWQALLFALIGGLILNAMPCVFPVLSLKALDIARQSGRHAGQVKARGLAYASGVVISFVVMAVVLILLQQAGNQIGWGTQFQSPLVVGIFAYFLFLIGLNLSGAFEIPMLFGNVGDSLTKSNDLKGSFFTGVLAVLVATPCTAPYMGGAIGYAFTQPPVVILAIFAAMGLGMALPFLALSLYPNLATKLPKPGEWMETFKNALAFPMYLSVLWLLWVLGRQTDTDIVSLIVLGFIILVFTIWLWQVLSDNDVLVRIGIAIPLIILSFAPLWFLPAESVNRNADSCAVPSMLEHGEPFTKTRLDQLRGQGRAVFVNATASWCITCQINERTTLGKDAIKKAFEEKDVVYLVADWTNRNEEITAFLDSFGRKGVPLYVYYPAKGDGVVLPQLLTESIVTEAISK
jgi:thiol:disulfide interchange protein DsbD